MLTCSISRFTTRLVWLTCTVGVGEAPVFGRNAPSASPCHIRPREQQVRSHMLV